MRLEHPVPRWAAPAFSAACLFGAFMGQALTRFSFPPPSLLLIPIYPSIYLSIYFYLSLLLSQHSDVCCSLSIYMYICIHIPISISISIALNLTFSLDLSFSLRGRSQSVSQGSCGVHRERERGREEGLSERGERRIGERETEAVKERGA
jgi:hypothetical protein